MEITKEMQEFARFASTTFAAWGFKNIGNVMNGKKSEKDYYYDMLCMLLTHFNGDNNKVWRFIEFEMLPEEVAKCHQYITCAHAELEKKG